MPRIFSAPSLIHSSAGVGFRLMALGRGFGLDQRFRNQPGIVLALAGLDRAGNRDQGKRVLIETNCTAQKINRDGSF